MNATEGGVRIRQLDRDEWAAWRDLRLRSLAEAPDAFCADLASEEAHGDEWWEDLVTSTLDHPSGALWCAEASGIIVGIAFSRVDRARTLHIGSMWVAPEGRSRGVGRSLLEAALEWGTDGGATKAELWVTVGNGHAEVLYQKAGFSDTGDRGSLREGSDLRIARMVHEL